MITVLIADDQRAVREGLATLVGLIDDIEVVGTAANGVEAIELAGQLRPQVVLMDLRMPEMDGSEATRAIRTTLPETHVLVLTTYADDDSLFRRYRQERTATSPRTRAPRRSSAQSAPSPPEPPTWIR